MMLVVRMVMVMVVAAVVTLIATLMLMLMLMQLVLVMLMGLVTPSTSNEYRNAGGRQCHGMGNEPQDLS